MTSINKDESERNVFDVANDVFEVMARNTKGRRDLAELNLTEAGKIIAAYTQVERLEAEIDQLKHWVKQGYIPDNVAAATLGLLEAQLASLKGDKHA